jgi:hypothetical protein
MSSRATLRIGTLRSLFAGVACAIAAVGLVACAPEPSPTGFPSWYPLENEQGDPAFADFESHVPCAIDPEPDPECQRVKLGIVLYRDDAGKPTTYVMSIVRVGVSDDREVHEGEWGIETGTPLDEDATVYGLRSGAPTTSAGSGRSATTCCSCSTPIASRGSAMRPTATRSTAFRSGAR